jgi:hypothetical protein
MSSGRTARATSRGSSGPCWSSSAPGRGSRPVPSPPSATACRSSSRPPWRTASTTSHGCPWRTRKWRSGRSSPRWASLNRPYWPSWSRSATGLSNLASARGLKRRASSVCQREGRTVLVTRTATTTCRCTPQLKMFTAREMTTATVTSDARAWTDMSNLAQAVRGMVSVGLKAVALVNDV